MNNKWVLKRDFRIFIQVIEQLNVCESKWTRECTPECMLDTIFLTMLKKFAKYFSENFSTKD